MAAERQIGWMLSTAHLLPGSLFRQAARRHGKLQAVYAACKPCARQEAAPALGGRAAVFS
ncbi:hypothetical protein GCM10009549_00240 [Streptomyces thermoalcalitolerans]|uniref:Uncharacterized protein n=1 Tax=Streptomyces thermoalcalitolerans TaxID=65605 RepID=A0ABP3YRB4_9ACTN